MKREVSNVNLVYEVVDGKLKLWACSIETGMNVLRIQTYGVEAKVGPLTNDQQDVSVKRKEVT